MDWYWLKHFFLLKDIRQAFLLIEEGEKNQDTLRLNWIKDATCMKIITLRLTYIPVHPVHLCWMEHQRNVLGVSKTEKKNPVADDIKKNLHVTDLISASHDKVETRKLERIASRSFSGGTFTQSKCYSNLKEFQGDTKQVKKTLKKNTCFSFAKVHGRATNNNTKIFRVA